MKKILIQFAHPMPSRSKINRALIKVIDGLEGVTINDLYYHYPDFNIDVKREQELCASHDIIIFQHPMYWYSTPALLKEWQDLVLEHGWAYGSDAVGLEGKYTLQALSAGTPDANYQKDGDVGITLSELISPYRATAKLCKMNWLPPFAVLGIHRGIEEAAISAHSEAYRRAIIALRDGNIDLEACMKFDYLNSDLDQVIRKVV